MITDIDILKKDLIRIENIKSFLVDIPRIHPDNPKYTNLWTLYTKYCIEGYWAFDNGGWRFMPPTLFFYGNFFKIKHTEKNTKVRKFIKPLVRDLDWHLHYAFIEAQGFSGWKNDDKYSADYALIDNNLYKELEVSHNESDRIRFNDLHTSEGKLKKYLSPRLLVRMVHQNNNGKPLYYNNAQNLQIFGCLAENSEIRMFDGSKKYVQDLTLGDKLMGPDSKERTVQNLYQGNGLMYNIKSKYSEQLNVTDTHILRLRKRTHKWVGRKQLSLFEEVNISVGDYLNNIYYTKEHKNYEFVESAIDYSPQYTKWHPYLLGLWLGDGFKKSRMICYCEDDTKHIEWIINHFKENNIPYRIKEEHYHPSKLGTKKMFRINWIEEDSMCKKNWFSKTLLNKKHIPNNYLINSRENRLLLLAGMIDSDGYYEEDGRRFTITNIDLNLLKQFQDLARSLGFRATISKTINSGMNKGTRYDLRITGNLSDVPTQLYRKQAKDSKSRHLNAFKIEFDSIQKFYGLDLDQDKLFVLGDYTVTHNCRGGGKSYSVSGITAHCLLFDGIKEFTKETYLNPPTAEVAIGAAITDKSSELIKKVTEGLSRMATDSDLGVWGKSTDDDFEPNPFFRTWKGDVKPGNKKNPYRYEYDVQTPNGWTQEGTKTALYHINYSDKKQDGDQAAAGGRYNICIYEEVGLMPNFIDALLSNVGTVSVDGIQFGVQIALGTSGNIELVQQSKKVFNNPKEYNFLGFENIWEDDEHARTIGLFLPVYLSDTRFKDQNGNTDIDRALKFYMDRRLDAMSKNDPLIIQNEKMNNPIIPSDMWQSNKGSYFPVMELAEREKELLKGQLYRSIGKPVKLTWDSKSVNGVKTELDQEKEPFYDFPFNRSMSTIEGCPIIYHEPEFINGVIPDDMYLFTFDPYQSDNIDEGGSVGVFYGYMNPKYWSKGYKQTIVCSYIGKNINGKDGFNEVCEKLIQYYGNCPRSYWFESNKGNVKDYFLRKDKLYLLALEPIRSTGSNIYAKKVQNYGVLIGTRVGNKVEMVDSASEWLLEQCWDNVRVVETIPCIFLVRQLMQFEIKGNFDAVSSFIIFPLALKEMQHTIENEMKNKGKHNPFSSININVFKQDDRERFKRKYEQINQIRE